MAGAGGAAILRGEERDRHVLSARPRHRAGLMDRRHNRWQPEPAEERAFPGRRRRRRGGGAPHLWALLVIVAGVLAIGMMAPSIRFESLISWFGFH